MLRRRIQSLFAALACLLLSVTQAYRVGDAVDTDLITTDSIFGSGTTNNVLRSQMPLFGLDSTSRFVLQNTTRSFSLAFEDGLWAIPTVYTQRLGEGLRSLHVAFVYSKSGAGAIHSVSTAFEYDKSYNGQSFRVRYQWFEEPDVSVTAGQSVMFTAVFIAGVIFALTACGLFDEDDEERTNADQARPVGITSANASSSVPKWD